MFEIGQVYKVVNPEGTGIRSCEKVEVTEVINNRQATAKSLEERDRFYGIHALMVEDGSLELEDPFSHLYKKESENLYTINDLHIHLDDSRSFLLQNLSDPAFRIYYDELESLMAVLLDIHKEKYGK